MVNKFSCNIASSKQLKPNKMRIIMEKEEILERIKSSINKEDKNKYKNSMGISESFYNPYYLIGRCFEDFTELEKMSETELNNIVRLADFASEAFY